MMAPAEVILSQKLLFVFHCFTNKTVLSASLKAKQLILVSKIILTDPYVASRDLQGRRTIQVRSSSKFKSSLQRAGTQFNSKRSAHANIAE